MLRVKRDCLAPAVQVPALCIIEILSYPLTVVLETVFFADLSGADKRFQEFHGFVRLLFSHSRRNSRTRRTGVTSPDRRYWSTPGVSKYLDSSGLELRIRDIVSTMS